MLFRSKLFLVPAAVAMFAFGCSSDSGSGDDDDDVAPEVDSGNFPVDPPFDAPPMEWTWIDVPGAECMNDTATGMGVNVNPSSNKLMIYLEGGGACFNAFTCTGVAHQNGFGSADFDGVIRDGGSSGVFNRDDDDNPFAGWNMIFVPYCTGDIFAGSNPDGFGGRNQVGYDNMGFYTDLLVEEFPHVNHVVLTGSSAGGFGASYNYDRVATSFGSTKVTLLDDSGPALGEKYMTPCFQDNVSEVWNLDATLPQECTDCFESGGLSRIPNFLATKYPDRNFGLITSTRDGVIRLFLGWGFPNCSNPTVPMREQDFADGVAEMRDTLMAPHDNFSVYTIESGLHVWLLENPLGSTEVSGVKITDWIRDQLDGDSGWDDVIP